MLLYDNYVLDLSRRINARLDDISVEYNFDYGDEFELAICHLLRDFLPAKFGVCRGFVVSKNGDKAGDDIIIYDQERFPTLRQLSAGDWSRKEKIPIEAVYGYVEAKHTLDISGSKHSNLSKAIDQIKEVKKLVNSREKYGMNKSDAYHVNKDLLDLPVGIYPSRNPLFAMVMSRKVSDGSDGQTCGVNFCNLSENLCQNITPDETFPEGIVCGPNIYLCASYINGGIYASRFFVPGLNNIYQHISARNMSMATGFIHLFSAIDWIRLGVMPWEAIFNDVKNKIY